MVKCPKCGGTKIFFSRYYTYVRSWYQNDKPANYHDFDEGDMWENDGVTEFICANTACNHSWEEDISPEEITRDEL